MKAISRDEYFMRVALDEADDDEIKALLDMSYALTMPKVKKASK